MLQDVLEYQALKHSVDRNIFLLLVVSCSLPLFYNYSYKWNLINEFSNDCMVGSSIDKSGNLLNIYFFNDIKTIQLYGYYFKEKYKGLNQNSIVLEVYSKPDQQYEIPIEIESYFSPYQYKKSDSFYIYSNQSSWIRINDMPLRLDNTQYEILPEIPLTHEQSLKKYRYTKVTLTVYFGINLERLNKLYSEKKPLEMLRYDNDLNENCK
jgi:hypothetical protein